VVASGTASIVVTPGEATPTDEVAGATVDEVAPGEWRVVINGRHETVYLAGTPGSRWAFWNGQVFRETSPQASATRDAGHGAVRLAHITAPMPATVVRVLAVPGTAVARGDTLVVVEAMKMELPLRAQADARIIAVRCHEGERVQAETVLVELGPDLTGDVPVPDESAT
jgi:acetyl/propionyl-CoA carboxylase alpha subunit